MDSKIDKITEVLHQLDDDRLTAVRKFAEYLLSEQESEKVLEEIRGGKFNG